MSEPALQYDIEIKKGSKFYQEFQFVDDLGSPISYVGKTLKGKVIESLSSPTVLHNLTEANGGVIRVNALTGNFAMFIPADETNVNAKFGLYDIIAIDDLYPDEEVETFVEGKVVYKPKITGV